MKTTDDVARALARVPSGLFILTAGAGDEAAGFLASWVQQAGFEPPALTVAIQIGRPILDLIRREARFCVSVLHEPTKAMIGHFAKGFAPGEPAFAGVDVRPAANGVPVLAGAHAHLACRLIGESRWSDHVILCGEVVGGAKHDDGMPLVHVRKTGTSY